MVWRAGTVAEARRSSVKRHDVLFGADERSLNLFTIAGSEVWADGSSEQGRRHFRLPRHERIRRICLAAESRDHETARHIEQMSRYCGLLAYRIGLEPARCELIRKASRMHDIGKLFIPDRILLKPDRLTEEEFAILKRHAEIGHRILHGSKVEWLELAATVALTHHENFDGSGYPRGLAGDQIPLEGRIAAIADVFDALTSKRVYKPAYAPDQAIDIMLDGRGSRFDPALLDVFLSCMDEALAIREEYAAESAALGEARPSLRMPALAG